MATENVIRASDTDREHAVEALRGQYAEGRLTLDEFDERVSAAYAATTWTDLRRLTSDLPVRLSFGTASAVATPGSDTPGFWRGWPVTSRAWLLAPLVPILAIGTVAAITGAWNHPGGDHFPFFPVIPLTIFGSIFAWRWLLFRQRRRQGAVTNRR